MKSFRRIVSIALALVLAFALCCEAFAIGNAEIDVGPSIIVTPTVKEESPFITDDHFAYIKGCPGGVFNPDDGLSRAEAATIFYRLLKDKDCDSYPTFPDVKKGSWYYDAVTRLADLDVISGYPDGTFKPDQKVSRAEFLKMAACFFDLESANVKFTDVARGKWYYKYISSAVAKEWIDNTATAYKPDGDITRAETVVIVNNILGREADEDFIEKNYKKMITFSDITPADPYFLDVMESANGHEFKTVKDAEVWTALAN